MSRGTYRHRYRRKARSFDLDVELGATKAAVPFSCMPMLQSLRDLSAIIDMHMSSRLILDHPFVLRNECMVTDSHVSVPLETILEILWECVSFLVLV